MSDCADGLFAYLSAEDKITFSGRRMYGVSKVINPGTGWLQVVCKPVPYFGMYGATPGDEEAYAKWVSSEGADPFYDAVLADSYVLLWDLQCEFQVICRHPYCGGVLGSSLLEVSPCS